MKNPFHQRKALQKRLNLSEQKFRTITETATDSIIITDQKSIIIYCNSKVEELFGYSREEMVGKNLDMIIPIKYREGHRQGVERFLKSGIPHVMGRIIELEALKKTGEIFPVELSLSYWKEKDQVYFTGIIRDISDRKKTERELIESEARLRMIAENTTDVISVSTLDGTFIYLSPSCEAILDYKPEELIGTSAFELYHPDDLPAIGVAFARAKESLAPVTAVFRSKKKDGSYIWFESTGRLIKDYKRETFQLYAINRDITERKKAEEELIESKHFIQQITDASPALISVFDLLLNKSIYTNKEIIKLLGYSPDEVIIWGPDAMNMLVHPDDIQLVRELYNSYRNLKDGEIRESEFRIKSSTGVYRWLYVRTTVFKRNSEGEVWQVLSNSLDISEQKKAEIKLKKAQKALESLNRNLEEKVKERTEALEDATEHLKQSENQLQLITKNLPAFISYIDKDRIYRFANDYYFKLSFISDTLVGRSVRDVLGEDGFLKNEAYMNRALTGETVLFESQVLLKSGETKHVEVQYLPDKDSNGNVRGFIVMAVDLTERLNYERELSRKNDVLKRINNDLDNFIYTASHDLKAPISNIEGLTNEIKDNPCYKDNAEFNTLINLMEVSIQRFKNTILDLTDITRVQKVMEGEIEEINLQTLSDEIQFLLKDTIVSLNAEVKTNFIVPTVRFSKKNLRSILYNLISNSLKYNSPDRSPVIELCSNEAGNCIELSVRDNGLGIPQNKMGQMFMMFKRFHAHVEGTGVGLYIVKRIIDNAGGRIEVESEVDKGTIFRIYLKK